MTEERTEAALALVKAERRRQSSRWGDQNGTGLYEWLGILGEEFGELCEAINETCFENPSRPEKGGFENILREAVHVAAVAVEIIEAMDGKLRNGSGC